MAAPPLNRDYARRPYWHATMPPVPDRAGRALPDTADVVVVGGGYTGVGAAKRFAELGARVVLLEANELGWGASTRNGGIVHPGFKWGPATLIRRHGEDLGRRLFGETVEAYSWLRDTIATRGIDAEWREQGH